MTERMTMAEAVTETLDALTLGPEYRAACTLAETYARQLDRAQVIEAQADRVLAEVEAETELDADEHARLVQMVSALKGKVTAHTTLANIGPKLESVLDGLGATPKGKAKIAKDKPGEEVTPGDGTGRLAQFRTAG